MQKYVNSQYYLNTYKGELIEANKLEKLIAEASKYIQKYTSNRATDSIEEVKYCCCAIVDKINEYNEQIAANKKQNNKKTESVGRWSVGYGETKTIKELEKDKESEIHSIIKLYLSEVTDKNSINLLYRGR